jgi:hypothetical protein
MCSSPPDEAEAGRQTPRPPPGPAPPPPPPPNGQVPKPPGPAPPPPPVGGGPKAPPLPSSPTPALPSSSSPAPAKPPLPSGPSPSSSDPAQFGGANAAGTAWVDKDPPAGLDMLGEIPWKKQRKEAKAQWEAANGVVPPIPAAPVPLAGGTQSSASPYLNFGRPNAEGTAWVNAKPPATMEMSVRDWCTSR